MYSGKISSGEQRNYQEEPRLLRVRFEREEMVGVVTKTLPRLQSASNHTAKGVRIFRDKTKAECCLIQSYPTQLVVGPPVAIVFVHCLAFAGVKSYVPFFTPLVKFVHISLKGFNICLRFDGLENFCIVGKKAGCRFQVGD